MSQIGIRKCRPRARAHRGCLRRLRFESLENRWLLTLAAFEINLYEDRDGEPGAAIESNALRAGDTFFLEISAEDVQPQPLGLHGISLDLRWDSQVFSVADPFQVATVVTDSLPLFAFGTLESEVGRINDLTGSAGLGLGVGALVGLQGPETFALIRFEALQAADESPFSLRGGKYGIAFFPPVWDEPEDFYFDTRNVTVVDASDKVSTDIRAETTRLSTADTGPTITVDGEAGSNDGSTDLRLEAVSPSEPGDASAEASSAVADPSADVIASTPDEIPVAPGARPQAAEQEPSTADTPLTTGQTVADEPVIDAADSSLDAAPDKPETAAPLAPSSGPNAGEPAYNTEDTLAVDALTETSDDSPTPASGTEVAAHEVSTDSRDWPSACIASPRIRQIFATAPAIVRQQVMRAPYRAARFIGPLLPYEFATRVIFAELTQRVTSDATPRQIADDLTELLAIDVNSQFGHHQP